MMSSHRFYRLAAATIMAMGWSASAAPGANYYEGKTINLAIGSDAGGGFDIYGRLIAKHLVRFIPGAPAIVVQNMPGAGGSKAANYVYSLAHKDGLTILMTQPGAIVGPLFEAQNDVRYDATKFVYIGSADASTKVCVTSERSAVKTMEDALAHKATLGAAGAGSAARDYAYLLNRTSGTQFAIVSGYKGFADILLAMDRGEVDGFCGLDWPSLKAQRPDMIRDKKLNVFVQFDLTENAELTALKVPRIWDYLKDEEKKAIVKLFISQQLFSRPFLLAPGTPSAQVETLRDAFAATMRDEQFLKEAARIQLTIDPATGSAVQRVVEQMYAAPKSVVEGAKRAVNPN